MRDVINTDERKKKLQESLQFPVDLLHGQMLRLSLKDKLFEVFQPAAEESMDALWNKCVEIEKDIQVINGWVDNNFKSDVKVKLKKTTYSKKSLKFKCVFYLLLEK